MADMQMNQALAFNLGGPAAVHIDISKVSMSDEQRAIVAKLLSSIKSTDRVSLAAQDQCEIGKCVASGYLADDEFQKIRGLKAALGDEGAQAGIIADFCLHVITLPT